MVNKLNKFEYTWIGYLLIAHLLTNLLFFILNLVKIKPEEEPEEEPEVLLAKKTELTIHCIISFVMLGFIIVFRLGVKDFFSIAMYVHLGVCVVVPIVANVWDESVTWLSWVFEIVSTGVLAIGAAMHVLSGSKFMKNHLEAVKQKAGAAQEAATQAAATQAQAATGAAAQAAQAAVKTQAAAANVTENPLTKFGKFLNFGKRKLK